MKKAPFDWDVDIYYSVILKQCNEWFLYILNELERNNMISWKCIIQKGVDMFVIR